MNAKDVKRLLDDNNALQSANIDDVEIVSVPVQRSPIKSIPGRQNNILDLLKDMKGIDKGSNKRNVPLSTGIPLPLQLPLPMPVPIQKKVSQGGPDSKKAAKNMPKEAFAFVNQDLGSHLKYTSEGVMKVLRLVLMV